MEKITAKYEPLYQKLSAIVDDYYAVVARNRSAFEMDGRTRAQRIEHFSEQLKKIEEYSRRVEFYVKLAEKHMSSKNLLATEGMEDIIGQPRELNFKHMHDWATFIDETNPDDPYAQRIYVMARCNQIYLKRKKEQFEAELERLNSSAASSSESEEAIKEARIAAAMALNEIYDSQDFRIFVQELRERINYHTDLGQIQKIRDAKTEGLLLSLGTVDYPLPVVEEAKDGLKAKLLDLYDEKTSTIKLPLEFEASGEMTISAIANKGKEKKLYRGIQNYLLERLSSSPLGLVKVDVLDAIHYNNMALGALRTLEGTNILPAIPSDAEKITDRLKEIIADFIDIDEKLGMVDSVEEYNLDKEVKDCIAERVVVLIGYPSSFSSDALELINRIILNNIHYGVSIVSVDNSFTQKSVNDDKDATKQAYENVIRLKLSEQSESVVFDEGNEKKFSLFELKENLSIPFIEAVKSKDVQDGSLGNEYCKRVDMNVTFPENYQRGRKKIILPFGVDSTDDIRSVSFSNENFASFLMGASGSGKSTLLHTLITGILKQYHPDDVELWLADFKMSEFAQYINPLPPHVKYILLDESPELVYDLIDKLTDKMMERQRYFMIHRNIKKVEDVPSDEYMPVIFIILDEFSIMSQAVAENEEYKLKLQNLLAKGRALGIKFLFSSQTFTKGIQGLTNTAKEQIQSRMAMKNSQNEITETLELSANQKTEKVRNWMEALPPHYVLYKYRDGDKVNTERMKVMYFPGEGTSAYQPQRDLINSINEALVKSDTYKPEEINTYYDKDPVIVDGNSYQGFNALEIDDKFRRFRKEHSDEYSADDTLFVLGTPRRMENYKISAFTTESRENLLYIVKNTEQVYSAANLLSIMQSFKMQGREVEIWAYGRDRLYRGFKDTHWNQFKVVEGIEDIKNAIHQLRIKIDNREVGHTLYVLMGIERIYDDFALAGTGEKKAAGYQQNENAGVSSTTEEMEQIKVQQWNMQKREIRKQLRAEGMNEDDIKAVLKQKQEEFYKGFELTTQQVEAAPKEEVKEEKKETINTPDDFKTLFLQGSRLGYHMLLTANSYLDFKQLGLKTEYFRHRCSYLLPKEESFEIFANRRAASELPEHICVYDNSFERFSFRSYLHPGLSWDGWYVEDYNGVAINSFEEMSEE